MTSHKKFFRVVLILLAAIILVIVLLPIALKPIVKNKIYEALPENHQLQFGKMNLSLIPLGISIYNVEWINTTAGQDHSIFKRAVIDTLAVSGIDVLAYVMHDRLEVENFHISGLHSELLNSEKDKSKKDSTKSKNSSLILNVTNTSVTNTSVVYFMADDEEPTLDVPYIDIKVRNFEMDFNNGDLMADNYQFDIKKIKYIPKSKLHEISAASILISGDKEKAEFDSIRIKPLVNASQLPNLVTYETGIIDLVLPSVKIGGMDFVDMYQSRSVALNHVWLNEPRLELYKDKTLKDKPSKLPSEMLKSIPFEVKVDSIQIHSGFIKYYELMEREKSPGHITFERLHGSIYNMNNQTGSGPAEIVANAYLMGSAKLEATFKFPFGFVSDTFAIKGSLDGMALSEINPMVMNVASVEVMDGMMQKMEFDFQANRNFSSGVLYFYYSDFKLALLNKDNNKQGIIKKIVSFVANVALISNNPRGEQLREGEIYFEREEPKSIFNYWWKSLFSGIKSSVTGNNKK